jgi:RNA polymerase sigma-70 factor (ECF subfamily)
VAVNYSELADTELMYKVKGSDSRALEALYNRYSSVLYTLVKKIVKDNELAEEVLIDLFAIIWRKSNLYDERIGNVYCWLITLARNKAVDSAKRKNGSPEEQETYNDEYEDYFIVPRLSPEIDDLDLKTAMNIKGNIEEALHKLTDAQQYVLYLAYYEGLSQSEIATRLKIPIQTVKSKVKLSLGNLKDNLLKGDE